MDSNEMQRLAAMGSALRPDWPVRSLVTFLERNLAARAYADTAIALAWVCTRTTTETPRLLLEAGPWWRATVVPGETGWRPPRRDEDCAKHPGSFAGSCFGCAADKRAGDETQPGDPTRPEAAAARERARAELAAIEAATCRHDVDRRRGRCAECDRSDQPSAATETKEVSA